MNKAIHHLTINNRPRPRARGQAMLELALILPVFLLILMAIVEAGRLLLIYSSVSSASREAARFGAGVGLTNRAALTPPYSDCAGIIAAAQRVTFLDTLDTIAITYDNPQTGFSHTGCPPSQINVGDRIVVTVTATYQPIVPLLQINAIPITSETRRTILKEVWID